MKRIRDLLTFNGLSPKVVDDICSIAKRQQQSFICAKAKRQQQSFICAKAKRQQQIAQLMNFRIVVGNKNI